MAPAKTTLTLAATAAIAGLPAGSAFVTPGSSGRPARATPCSECSSARSIRGAAQAASAHPSARAGLGTAVLGAAAVGTLASAAAGPLQRRSKRRAVSLAAFENELGVQEPVGFWDPAGFTADGDAENFARRRQTELKHGRISMLATMGYITPEITGKLPGFLSPSAGLKFADIPNGLGAISKVPALGWAQIVAYCAVCELSQDQSPGTPAAAGDFGWKVLTSTDPAEKEKKLAAEIANGRLAMMAIIGMFFQDGLTGSAWGDWVFFETSPLTGIRKLYLLWQNFN